MINLDECDGLVEIHVNAIICQSQMYVCGCWVVDICRTRFFMISVLAVLKLSAYLVKLTFGF